MENQEQKQVAFTPGQWRVYWDRSLGTVSYFLDNTQGFESEAEAGANAKLIESAPDLLAALSFAEQVIKEAGAWTSTCQNVIGSAILKATK